MKTERFEKILWKLILLSNQFLTLVGNFSINFLLFAIKAETTAKNIPRNAPARTSDPVEDIIPEIREVSMSFAFKVLTVMLIIGYSA